MTALPAAPPDSFAVWKDVIIPIATFVLGFLISRFTLTKKERKDLDQVAFVNARELSERHTAAFQDYAKAIEAYCSCPDDEGLDHFLAIATAGEKYFYQLKIEADAILLKRVDERTREHTLMPDIREAVSKTLPDHISTLNSIAEKKGYHYNGDLRRENYSSLFEVVEQYPAPEWHEAAVTSESR